MRKFISVLLVSLGLHAQSEVAKTQAPRDPERRNLCLALYQLHECAAYFKENPENAKYAVDCDHEPDVVDGLKKCAESFKAAGVDIYNFITTNPAITPERRAQIAYFETCAKSMECKRALIESASGSPLTGALEARLKEVTDGSMLESMHMLQLRKQSSAKFEKVREILKTRPDSPERDDAIEALQPGWKDRKKTEATALWWGALEAAKGLLKKAQCYNGPVQTEAVCYGIALMAEPAAAAKLVSRLPALSAAAGARVSQAFSGMSRAQAREYLGFSSMLPGEGIRKAISYVNSKTYPSVSAKAADLKTMLSVIESDSSKWSFRVLRSSDGSTVFSGYQGHAIVISPSGQVFTGRIGSAVYDAGYWIADYSPLVLVP